MGESRDELIVLLKQNSFLEAGTKRSEKRGRINWVDLEVGRGPVNTSCGGSGSGEIFASGGRGVQKIGADAGRNWVQ
jgi:hypothetical protein